jgi:hypothetical protein
MLFPNESDTKLSQIEYMNLKRFKRVVFEEIKSEFQIKNSLFVNNMNGFDIYIYFTYNRI